MHGSAILWTQVIDYIHAYNKEHKLKLKKEKKKKQNLGFTRLKSGRTRNSPHQILW